MAQAIEEAWPTGVPENVSSGELVNAVRKWISTRKSQGILPNFKKISLETILRAAGRKAS